MMGSGDRNEPDAPNLNAPQTVAVHMQYAANSNAGAVAFG